MILLIQILLERQHILLGITSKTNVKKYKEIVNMLNKTNYNDAYFGMWHLYSKVY